MSDRHEQRKRRRLEDPDVHAGYDSVRVFETPGGLEVEAPIVDGIDLRPSIERTGMSTQEEVIAAINAVYASYEAVLDDHERQARDIDDLNARILVLQQDNAAKQERIDAQAADLIRLDVELDDLVQKKADLEAEIVTLKVEVKRLKDLYEPTPDPVRVLESYGAPGGGGINLIEGDFLGTDVGAMVRLYPDSWESAKWNLGLGGARHIASLTKTDGGLFVMHGGSPGSQEGVFLYAPETQKWSGPVAGSKQLFVNSQNSYGDPNSTVPSAWKFGYGTWEQRSVGRLTWMRDNGDLVCGQFGYAGGGKGGVAVLSNGVKRVIPGTENWACRAVQRISDRNYLVSVEKARVPNTALPTPGGLWSVNVDTNSVVREPNWPDTPEHLDYANGILVAACRNQGIMRSGQDITFNLPRASEWYSVAINERGDILAGCMDPQQVNGFFWSVALLQAGSTTWVNLTPGPLPNGKYLPTLNSAEPFAAVNRNNTLGLGGATVTDVAWRGDVPMCSASGIVWGAPDKIIMQPAPGSWILVNRAYDRTPDGYEAFAASDFRALWRKPGGRWQKAPFSGGNDGADVSWLMTDQGSHVLHYRGPGGERQAFSTEAGIVSNTAVPMPPKQPQAPMTDEKRQAIIDSFEVQQFGERYGTFAVSETDLIVYGHGAAVSRLTQA